MRTTQNRRNSTSSSSPKKRRGPSIWSRILHGSVLSGDFFRRYWLQVFIIVAMIMIFITNKYQCKTSIETIQKLEHELAIVKTEHINQHSRYMSATRESQMQRMVDSLGLGLSVQEQPPYHIRYNGR